MQTNMVELLNPLSSSTFMQKHLYGAIQQPLSNGEYNIDLIKNVMFICSCLMQKMPSKSREIEIIKDKLELIIQLRIKNSELVEEFEKLLKIPEKVIAKKEERNYFYKNKITMDHLEPPSSFTQLSIIPSLDDIRIDNEPFLRANITNGSYRSVEHYLDVQFRLLREDFMQPLRTSVNQIHNIIKGANVSKSLGKDLVNRIKGIESINIYFDVKMNSNVATNSGIVYSMSLTNNEINNWEKSKKLMFGSLVCLSSDYFMQNCIIGIVCDRDIKRLSAGGDIYIKFDQVNDQAGTNFMNLPKPNETYMMIETAAYFESYKHVLEALVSFQHIGEKIFPFKENLVFCQNKIIAPPAYLKDAYIDFRPLVDKSKQILTDPNTGLSCYKFAASSNYAESCFIGNEQSWPSPDQFGFDLSQYKAMQLVLTSKLALIQG